MRREIARMKARLSVRPKGVAPEVVEKRDAAARRRLKGITYAHIVPHVERAWEAGFRIEAIVLAQAIAEDRLKSLLRRYGGNVIANADVDGLHTLHPCLKPARLAGILTEAEEQTLLRFNNERNKLVHNLLRAKDLHSPRLVPKAMEEKLRAGVDLALALRHRRKPLALPR